MRAKGQGLLAIKRLSNNTVDVYDTYHLWYIYNESIENFKVSGDDFKFYNINPIFTYPVRDGISGFLAKVTMYLQTKGEKE